MKKMYFIAALFAIGVTAAGSASAQVNIRVNIGNSRPVPAPVVMDEGIDSYYYPDLNVYFDISSRNYRYIDGGRWITSHELPYAYHNRDMSRMRRVPMYQQHVYRQDDRRRDDDRQPGNNFGQNQMRNNSGRDYNNNNDHRQENGQRNDNRNERNRNRLD